MNIFVLIFYIRKFAGVQVGLSIHDWADVVCGFAVLISLTISLSAILNHLVHYTDPEIQRYLVRILLMMPIYAIDSAISVFFKEISIYVELGRDCYEGYVLYTFFMLVRNLLGGERNLIRILEHKPPLKHQFPLSLFGCYTPHGTQFLHRTKQILAQFVLVQPITQSLAIIMVYFDIYDEGSWNPWRGWFWITIIDNISISLALYWLVLFYTALKTDLEPYRALSKFLCIKMILFFVFWQSFVISLAESAGFIESHGRWSEEDITRAIGDLLICVECVPLSFAFNHAFGLASMKLKPLPAHEIPTYSNRPSRDFSRRPSSEFKHYPSRSASLRGSLDLGDIERGTLQNALKSKLHARRKQKSKLEVDVIDVGPEYDLDYNDDDYEDENYEDENYEDDYYDDYYENDNQDDDPSLDPPIRSSTDISVSLGAGSDDDCEACSSPNSSTHKHTHSPDSTRTHNNVNNLKTSSLSQTHPTEASASPTLSRSERRRRRARRRRKRPLSTQISALQGLVDVANVKDVLFDSVGTFVKGATKSVVVADFLGLKKSEQMKRVLVRGYMLKRRSWRHPWTPAYFMLLSSPVGLLYYKTNPWHDNPDEEILRNQLEEAATELAAEERAGKPSAPRVGRPVHVASLDPDFAQKLEEDEPSDIRYPEGFIDFTTLSNMYNSSARRNWWAVWGEMRWRFSIVSYAKPMQLQCADERQLNIWMTAVLQAYQDFKTQAAKQSLETFELEDFTS